MTDLPCKLIITNEPLETFRGAGRKGWCLLKFKIFVSYGMSTRFGMVNDDTVYVFDNSNYPSRYEYDSWMGAMFALAKGETLFLQDSLQNRIDGHKQETPYTGNEFRYMKCVQCNWDREASQEEWQKMISELPDRKKCGKYDKHASKMADYEFAEAWPEINLSEMEPHKRAFARKYPSLATMGDFYEKNAGPGKCSNWCGNDAIIPVTYEFAGNVVQLGDICEQCRKK
jgi:hypothetical protein